MKCRIAKRIVYAINNKYSEVDRQIKNNKAEIDRGKKLRIATIYIRIGLTLIFLALFYSYIHLKAYQIIVFDPIFRGTRPLNFQSANVYKPDLIRSGLRSADSVLNKISSDMKLCAIAITCKNEHDSTKIRIVIDFLYTGADSDKEHPTNAICIRYSPSLNNIILIDRDVGNLIPALRESNRFISNEIVNEDLFKEYENSLSHCNLKEISDFPNTSLCLPGSIVLLVNDLRNLYGYAMFFPVLDSGYSKNSKLFNCVIIQKETTENNWICRTMFDNSYNNIRDIEPIEAMSLAYNKINDIKK